MNTETFDLWNKIAGKCIEIPKITAYVPQNKTHDSAVVIFPGGGYVNRAQHEGEGYARFLSEMGITAFVVHYRVKPHTFPCQLLDARRAVKFVRYHAEKYGIDKNKIAVMGSSAGGHLASLVSTYFEDINCEIYADDIEKECFVPNAQILCYPVIFLCDEIGHKGSGLNLLGDDFERSAEEFETARLVSDKTPPAFVWHTATDKVVNVANSMRYTQALKDHDISSELHIFPHGPHGLGLCERNPETDEMKKIYEHVSQWGGLLINWLGYIGF